MTDAGRRELKDLEGQVCAVCVFGLLCFFGVSGWVDLNLFWGEE